MRHMATQNSNQWTTQGGWRYTPCGKCIISRTYIGYVDICPNPTSSGTVSTPRMLSSRMVMPLEFDHYARRAYMGRTATDRHRIHRPLPTVPGQCFLIDAFACGQISQRGYKYCDLMRDGASQMMYCNFTKNREADEIVRSFTRLWDLHSTWRVFDHKNPDKLNP